MPRKYTVKAKLLASHCFIYVDQMGYSCVMCIDTILDFVSNMLHIHPFLFLS